MGTYVKLVVFLYVTSAVLCTPFVNKLQPGQEWPARSSVKQPQPEVPQELVDREGSVKETEDTIEVEKAPEADGQVKDTPEEPEKVDYSGCQVWKVVTTKTSAKRIINKLSSEKLISSWGGNKTTIDVLITPDAIDNVTDVFKSKQISYDIMIEDLQQRINEENPPLNENEIELQDRRGHRMTWKQYHSVEDMHGFMDYLATTYPTIISVNSIGKSFEGRDLKVLRISNGNPNNKAVFIDGGLHAREWISPAVVTYHINQIAENFDAESDDIKNIDWYFLPSANPDGYEYTHKRDRLWRKNRKGYGLCIGTDLNRNFGYNWGGRGSSGNPCSVTYRGTAPFSEPESKAMADFFAQSSANFAAYITYHSYGQLILYPWGYACDLPVDHKDLQFVGDQIAEAILQERGTKYQVGSACQVLYEASGGSDDWAKARNIKYSYTIELSDTGRYGFVLPARYIESVAKESFDGLRVLAHHVNKL